MGKIQDGRIILVDHTEMTADGHGSYLRIFSMGGETYRIPEKRSALWEVFKSLRKGEPVLALFEEYLGNQYITEAKPIADEILRKGIQKLGERLADQVNEEKNRSVSLSYAISLAVGNIIKLDNLYKVATDNYQFIKGAIPDENLRSDN